jgi:hypothetical protein
MRAAWLGGMVLVAVAVAPVWGDEWTRRYEVHGRPDVHVRTDDANVRIEGSGDSEITARVTTAGWRVEPGEVTITEGQAGDRVDIEVRLPKAHPQLGGGHPSASVLLRIPRQADLDVHTGDGSIEVEPVSGRISLSTGDGSITARGLEGEIHLHTGDGSIQATGLSGRLRADTGDGHLNVRGRFDLLDLHSGDGSVDAAAEPGSKVEVPWSLRSGDGGITLDAPTELDADLDVQAGDGGVFLEKPVSITGTISPKAVHGKLGAGGLPIRIHTGDGSIRLLGL